MPILDPGKSISMLAELPGDIYWFFKRLFRKRHREKIRVSGFLIQETEKAYLLKTNKIVAWVPKAVCEELGRKKRGIVLLMERWMAEKKFGEMENSP